MDGRLTRREVPLDDRAHRPDARGAPPARPERPRARPRAARRAHDRRPRRARPARPRATSTRRSRYRLDGLEPAGARDAPATRACAAALLIAHAGGAHRGTARPAAQPRGRACSRCPSDELLGGGRRAARRARRRGARPRATSTPTATRFEAAGVVARLPPRAPTTRRCSGPRRRAGRAVRARGGRAALELDACGASRPSRSSGRGTRAPTAWRSRTRSGAGSARRASRWSAASRSGSTRRRTAAASTAAGMPVAVLACGPDVAYPRRHRGSAPGGPRARAGAVRAAARARAPFRWSFPARNRIMAGLARMTVVVEAADPSGQPDHERLRARPGPGGRRRARARDRAGRARHATGCCATARVPITGPRTCSTSCSAPGARPRAAAGPSRRAPEPGRAAAARRAARRGAARRSSPRSRADAGPGRPGAGGARPARVGRVPGAARARRLGARAERERRRRPPILAGRDSRRRHRGCSRSPAPTPAAARASRPT